MVQDQELIYPQYRLDEAGYEVTIAAEKEGEFFGIQGVKFKADMAFREVWLNDYDLMVIPGGVKCMEHMRLERYPKALILHFHEMGKVIGCICSGAFLLISAGLCKGRKIAIYPAWQVDVENAGGTFVNGVVTDDRIVTAPHYRDAGRWMAAVLDAVRADSIRDSARVIAASIPYAFTR